MNYSLSKCLVQHLLIPFLQTFGFGYFLVRWVAMKDVIISFTGGTGPDVPCHIPVSHTTNNICDSHQKTYSNLVINSDFWLYLLNF